MRTTVPTISVVVPLGPRLEHLQAQLEALAAQDSAHAYELILSCNGIPVAEPGEFPLPSGLDVRFGDSSAVLGPSHARNVGWRAAAGDVILFCDADDVVAPGWVATMTERLADADVVGGALEFDRLNARSLGGWGRIAITSLPSKFSHHEFVPSGNLGVWRSVLEALDGFDEALHRSEDVDFSWRAIDAGHRLAFAPRAVVHCRRRETFAGLFAQAREDAAHDPALLKRHAPAGARWRLSDYAREAAGVAVAAAQVPFGAASKLATRLGRFTGHLAHPSMLRMRG